MREPVEDLTKIKNVKLSILYEGCSDYQTQGVFENIEDCMLHILFYEGAILKRDVLDLLEIYKKFFVKGADNE